MKKILMMAMIFSLVFAFGAVGFAQEQGQGPDQGQGQGTGPGPAQNQRPDVSPGQGPGQRPEPMLFGAQGQMGGLERIPSPDQIKNFENVKKQGNALFGKRKGQNKDELDKTKKEKSKDQNETAKTGTSSLEKISHPDDIKLFDKVLKIGNALWGLRRGGAEKPKPPVFITSTAAQCVKDAIVKKDTAIKADITTRDQAEQAAIDARTACQSSAIDKTTAKDQAEANRACLDTFKKYMDGAKKAFDTSRNEAWKTYGTDLKACTALQGNTASGTPQTTGGEINFDDGGNGV
jgi:hypothetical protein